jgi:hypothetical protein
MLRPVLTPPIRKLASVYSAIEPLTIITKGGLEMKRKLSISLLGLALIAALSIASSGFSSASAADDGASFEVTVTNVTRGQQFTPIFVAVHEKGVNLFTLGDPASDPLATLAEQGDTGPLSALLSAMPEVKEVVTAGPLLDPGDSRTVTVQGGGKFDHISLAAMLIPTNDAFVALNGVKALKGKTTLVFYSPAYDAGSEVNDELCASIPGPSFVECGGPGGGGMPAGGEEGYVHIHAGIHGIGDLNASERDWRNPVAVITIERVDGDDDDDD